jgi:hypothetical protein
MHKKMHFIIALIDNNVNMFLDIIYTLQTFLDDHNHTHELKICPTLCSGETCKCCDDYKNTETQRVFIIGTGLRKHNIPKNSILSHFECLADFEPIFCKPSYILDNQILNYCPADAVKLREKYPNIKVDVFKFGYTPAHDMHNDATEKIFDCAFVGAVTPLRLSLIKQLLAKGLKVWYHPTHFISGKERADLYNSTKVVVSSYAYEKIRPNPLLSRVIPAVSNKAFVIQEESTEPTTNDLVKDFVLVCDRENLVNTIYFFATNDEERDVYRHKFYSNLKKIKPVIPLFL